MDGIRCFVLLASDGIRYKHDLTIELKICHEHDRFDGWTGMDHLMREIMKRMDGIRCFVLLASDGIRSTRFDNRVEDLS